MARDRLEHPCRDRHCRTSHYVHWIQVPGEGRRGRLARYLRGKDIYTTFHYQPLSMSTLAKDCPVLIRQPKRRCFFPFTRRSLILKWGGSWTLFVAFLHELCVPAWRSEARYGLVCRWRPAVAVVAGHTWQLGAA